MPPLEPNHPRSAVPLRHRSNPHQHIQHQPRPRTFAYLSGLALCLALSGLMGNLMHLQTLMMSSSSSSTNHNHELFAPSISQRWGDSTTTTTATTSRKMTASTLDNDDNKELVPFLSQDHDVLRTVLHRAVTSLEECHGTRGEEPQSQRRLDNTWLQLRLPPFGFVNDLTSHLSVLRPLTSHHYHNNNNQTTTTRPHLTTTASSSSQSQRCHLFPATACHTTQMTMMVFATAPSQHYHDDDQNRGSWRTLFLNLLHWSQDPALDAIHVVVVVVVVLDVSEANHDNYDMPTTTEDATLEGLLQNDTKYGHRLLSWHRDDTHKVTLHMVLQDAAMDDHSHGTTTTTNTTATTTRTSTLWERVAQVFQDNNNNDDQGTTNDAVLLMNGDVPFQGNVEGFHAGLELWKRHASSLVGTQVVAWSVGDRTRRIQTTADNATAFERICPQDSVSRRSAATSHADDTSSSAVVLDWSGLILHRSYLACWLGHPVTKALASRTRSSSSLIESTLLTMVMWLSHLSGSEPRLYPSKVLRNGLGAWTTMRLLEPNSAPAVRRTVDSVLPPTNSTTRDASNTTTVESSTVKQQTSKPRLRKAKGKVSGTRKQNTAVKSHTTTTKSKRKMVNRRLQAVEYSSLDESLVEIARYFGSLPARAIDWCPGSATGPLLATDERSCIIPWMKLGDVDNGVC